MLSNDKNNTPEEIQALKLLREGFLPEIQESEFLRVWLGAFTSEDSKQYVNAWVEKVAKNPNQKVKIMRGATHVATVPAILTTWPTEAARSPKETISELVASAQNLSSRIPKTGVTHLRTGLASHFERIAQSPVVAQMQEAHQKEWAELFAFYKVTPPTNRLDTTLTQAQEDTSGLFDDFEEL